MIRVKKYISRKMIYRMLLFAAVVLSAVLFDAFHQGNEQSAPNGANSSQSSQMIVSAPEFCVNQASTFRLINGADKLFSGLVFAGTSQSHLSEWHNYRSFYLFKAESPNRNNLFLLSAHFMKFNSCHHSNPDDSAASA